MAQASYELRYYNCQGVYQFNLENIDSLQYGRKKNDLGIAVVVVDGINYDIDQFEQDGILEIYREGQLVDNTCWFLRKQEISINSNCDEVLTLTFYDTIHLLTRRIVAWDGVDIFNYPSFIREPLDDILKYLAYFNFGPGTDNPAIAANAFAPGVPNTAFSAIPVIESWQFGPYGAAIADLTNREFNIGITFFTSESAINTQSVRFEHLTLLEAMQNVAEISTVNGESLWFDIEYQPASGTANATFIFRTWVGVRNTDRSQGINLLRIGPEFNNMINATIVRDWENEKTIMYAAGNGDNENRDMAFATRASPDCPFYPIEGLVSSNFGDGINVHNLSEGIAAAQVGLFENRFIETMTGEIINVGEIDFFNRLQYGDRVVLQHRDFSVVRDIEEYEVNVDSSGEEISIPVTT